MSQETVTIDRHACSGSMLVAPFEAGINPFSDIPEGSISSISASEAFATGIDTRDGSSCVICGFRIPGCVDHAHIVPRTDTETWNAAKMAGWIPATARSVIHEPRNGILLCKNHHGAFDHHQFFIRFVRERQEYVLINLKHRQDLEQFHGHALHLGINDPRAPWPTLFLLHERITVAKSPFHPPRWIPAPVEFPPISSASGLDPTEPFGPAALNQGELHQTSAGGRPSFAGSHRIPDTRPPASGGSGGENTRNTGVSATHGTALGAQLPSIHECASNGITSPSSQDNSGHSHCVSYRNQKYQQDTQSARSSTTAPATWSAASNPAADVAANNSRFSPETVVANFAFQKLYVDDIRDPGTYFSKEMMENLGFVWDCPEATTAWSGSTTENIQRWNAMRKGEEYCNQD